MLWKEDEGLKSEKMQMGKRARKQRAYGDVGRTNNILVLLGSIWAPNHPSVEFTGSIKLGSKKSSATNESIITKHRQSQKLPAINMHTSLLYALQHMLVKLELL